MERGLAFADHGDRYQLLGAGGAGIAETGDHAAIGAVGLGLAGKPHDLGLGERHVVLRLDAVGSVRDADDRQVDAGRGAGLIFKPGLLRERVGMEDRDNDTDVHGCLPPIRRL